MVAAAATVNREKNAIHLITEADITEPRRLIAEHRACTGERLSLTGYVVACLARTFDAFPKFNAFRKGSRLIVLDDLTISVLFEREIDGENVPEPVGIQAANRKTLRQINDELRSAQQWAVPLTSATVTVAVGAIARRTTLVDGEVQEREHLCLTVSFDHDIVDGAPAARFVSRFTEQLSMGDELRDLIGNASS